VEYGFNHDAAAGLAKPPATGMQPADRKPPANLAKRRGEAGGFAEERTDTA